MFNQGDYDEYDQPCKQLCIAHLPRILEKYEPGQYDGLKLYENPDQFGIDLLGMHNNGPLHVECEYKRTKYWNGPFPYDWELNILYRKKKFIGPVPTLFVVINHDFTQLATVTGAVLAPLPPVGKDTTNRGPDEFFVVPRAWVKTYPVEEQHEPATR